MAKSSIWMHIGLAGGAGLAIGGLTGFLIGRRRPAVAGAGAITAQTARGINAQRIAEYTVSLGRGNDAARESARAYLASISGYYRSAPGYPDALRVFTAPRGGGSSATTAPVVGSHDPYYPEFPDASPYPDDRTPVGVHKPTTARAMHAGVNTAPRGLNTLGGIPAATRASSVVDTTARGAAGVVLVAFVIAPPLEYDSSLASLRDDSTPAYTSNRVGTVMRGPLTLRAQLPLDYAAWLREVHLVRAGDTASAVGGGPVTIQ